MNSIPFPKPERDLRAELDAGRSFGGVITARWNWMLRRLDGFQNGAFGQDAKGGVPP